jgi:predicted phage terminase large subunit-like protein
VFQRVSSISQQPSSISPEAQRLARMKAVLQVTVLDNRWIPGPVRQRLTQKQAQFLASDQEEVFYGGAAGGGKSYALLMGALQYVDEPTYSATILRRTFKQLDKPESVMSVSRQWLANTPAKWNEQKHQWTFPSGATLIFGHMQTAKALLDYQGSAYHYVGFDELTQFEEAQYLYLFSRMRKAAESRLPVRMRSAGNPGGPGHVFVRKRFIDPRTRQAGALFIPASISDNPNLDRDDYVSRLAHLDSVTRAQLLEGNWDATGEGRFKREWLRRWRIENAHLGQGGEYVLGERRYPVGACWLFQTCDPAASAASTVKKNDPDWTVVSTWAVTPDARLIWLDCHRFRADIPDIVPQLEQAWQQWRPLFIGIEAVASNRAVLQIAQRTAMVAREISPRGLDKLVRATPAMILAETGRLWLPERAHWLEDAEVELLLFDGSGKTHDDVVDSLSMAAGMMDEHTAGHGALPFAIGGRSY